MITEWQEFTADRKAFEALVTEKRDLNARERELDKEIKAAATQGGIYDSALDLQVSGIGTRLAFIQHRRAALAGLIATALEDLRHSFHHADNCWTAICKGGYPERKSDYYALNALVFGCDATPPIEPPDGDSVGKLPKRAYLYQGLPGTIREDTASAMISGFLTVVKMSLPGGREPEETRKTVTPKKSFFKR